MYWQPAYLSRQQRELVVSLESREEWVLVGDEIVRVVSVDGNPVAASVQRDVGGKLSVVHSPHVVVALYEGAVQPLFLDESGGGKGRERY